MAKKESRPPFPVQRLVRAATITEAWAVHYQRGSGIIS